MIAVQDINIDLNEIHQNTHEMKNVIVKLEKDEVGSKEKKNVSASSLCLARIKAFGNTDIEANKAKKEGNLRFMLGNQNNLLSPNSPKRNEKTNCNIFTGNGFDHCNQDGDKSKDVSMKNQSDEISDEKCHLIDFINLPRKKALLEINKSNANTKGEKQDVKVFSSQAIHTVNKNIPNMSPRSTLNLSPIRTPNTSPGPSPVLTPGLLPFFSGLSLPSIRQISKSRSTTPVDKKNDYIK